MMAIVAALVTLLISTCVQRLVHPPAASASVSS
jgi:hypothetical protein